MPTISVYLPDEDATILDQMAKKENRSVSNMVATLIKTSYQVVGVTELPRPADAQPVPVVTIQAQA